jgi:hypothetical protein
MKLSQNVEQRLMLVLFLLLDTYRILIGSFYSIFVPQSCPDFKHTPVNATMTYHTCTLEDNISDLSTLNEATIGINAATATLMIVAFIFEVRRENWMIKHLDVDPKKADTNLITEIEAYPHLKVAFLQKNRRYRNIFYAVAVINTINIAVSAALVGDYFDGLKTITTFLTNALLIVLRIVKSIQLSKRSEAQMKALSVYISEPTTFNTIDPKFRLEDAEPKKIDAPPAP